MLVSLLKWIVVILALTSASYMAFDGTRAFVKGDYLRPKSGEYAGQLGPWSKLAEKAGIDPMSGLMKTIFIVYGIAGMVIAVCYAIDLPWAWKALLIYNVLSLWNLFLGTMTSIVQIILLLIIRFIR